MKYNVIDLSYKDLLRNIRDYFKQSELSIWDKRNKIKVVSYNNKDITIKSFKIPHFINKVAYSFIRDSKAKRSYENSLKIISFVPKPIGYAEFKKYGLLQNSYFVCEKYDYDFTIREVLTQKDFLDRNGIFKAFAKFTLELHKKGVEHLDYSPGNILIRKLQNKYEFKIIDVNRMRFKELNEKEALSNFSKLWADDEDLKCIIKEYASLAQLDILKAQQIALGASHKHKHNKQIKKRLLKGIKKQQITYDMLERKRNFIENISVVIMAKNAQKTITHTLESLKLFDEVVVYLNNSTDKTKEIAQSYENVKLIEGEFLGFGRTKNEAATYSKHNWILSLDSDEILNPEIINELMQQDYSDPKKIYRLKRDNYFLNHKTQNSNLIVRLYNKEFTAFDNNDVHEKVIVPKNSDLITLSTSFKHLYITDINQTLTKIIHYTDLGSKDKTICFFSIVIAKSIFAFFKTYILQGNILKGWVGYVLAVNSANKRHYKYVKQYINCKEKNKKENKEP
jgi:hypothetical protein